jgi:protein TonB
VTAAREAPRSLAIPVAVSALLHLAIIALATLMRAPAPKLLPPMYRVNLIAAPAGPRAVGVATEVPAVTPPVTAAATTPPKTVPKAAPSKSPRATRATKVPVNATPSVTPPPAPARPVEAPKAGSGTVGGRGTDVIQVDNEGIAFPYQAYLDNIVRQIALNFSPRGNIGALRAEVSFLIRRDGSITAPLLLTRSGSKAFDLEALGAVEAASRAFGRLPPGYSEDALPIIFTFDPARMK